MTINKAIEQADLMRPNPVSDTVKGRWLCGFEQRLRRELGVEAEMPEYPDDGEAGLMAGEGYEDIYVFYLCAMIDFMLGEYESYNSMTVMLNSLLERYKKQHLRDNLPQKKSFAAVWRDR